MNTKPDTLLSAILTLPGTLAPLTSFHASKRRDIGSVPRVLLLSVRMISNHPTINYSIQMTEIMSLTISFLSCVFFVNACRSNHTHVGASSSHDNISHGLTKSRVHLSGGHFY